MEIEILTHGKARRGFIEGAAKFFAKELNILNKNYKVVIVTDPSLKEQGSAGLCAKTGDREITIALYSYLSLVRLMFTLAHEMVHVKQMVRGHYKQKSMKYGKGVYHFWLGKRVNKEYMDRPWEIEARGREHSLVDSLIEYLGKRAKKQQRKKA